MSGDFAVTANYTSDSESPSVQIKTPTSEATYTTSSSTITLGGEASDNIDVTEVHWSNETGGGGSASGTDTWIISNIHLTSGLNKITVTARDAANNTHSDSIAVTFDESLETPLFKDGFEGISGSLAEKN